MCVVPDVAMSGRWYRGFGLLCLVTHFFGFLTSKVRGMYGKVFLMSFICLVGVCFWLGVGADVGVVFMVARRWR